MGLKIIAGTKCRVWLAVPPNLSGIKGAQLIEMDVSLSWYQPVPFKTNITIIDLCE